jgi:hypothetical protein
MVTSEPVKQIEIMDPTKKDKIQCFDPSTKQRLGDVVAMTPHKSTRSVSGRSSAKDVVELPLPSEAVYERFKSTLCCIDDICRVSTRDSANPSWTRSWASAHDV